MYSSWEQETHFGGAHPIQPKLLFGDKDLGRAFQELNGTWEVELPIEASLKRFLEGTFVSAQGGLRSYTSQSSNPSMHQSPRQGLKAAGGYAQGDAFESLVGVSYTDAEGATQTESLPDVEHLTGSTHNDVLAGDRRDNVLDGGAGDDKLYGGPGGGDDVLVGNTGNDRLFGGQGQDRLEGGTGNDRLAGGHGADVFIFESGHGTDTITDFSDTEDKIDLSAFGLSGYDDLTVSSSTDGVTIDLSAHDGGTILLEGFVMANLDAADFLF